MWDDVVIGDDEYGQKSFVALCIRLVEPVPPGFSISQNERAYYIANVFMGLGMTVYKDTDVGKEFKTFVRDGADAIFLQLFLLRHLLPRVDPAKLRSRLAVELEDARQDGMRAKAREIRQVLHID